MNGAAETPAARSPHTGRGAVWAAGLVVALGAGVATAHGLYEVAVAAGVPAPIAWLYPLITDGLALVAYAATARLHDAGSGYAWIVVILAAGLSGLAQATHLAGAVATAPVALRFGVGAWPAIAAAIVAHLLYLLGAPPTNPLAVGTTDEPRPDTGSPAGTGPLPVPPGLPVPPAAATGTPVRASTQRHEPVRRTGSTRGQAPRRTAAGPRPVRADDELLALLAGKTAPVSVRSAARELGCGVDRARRLLAQAGLLAGSVRSSGRAEEPAESADGRRALHIVHGTPKTRTER